LSVRYNTSQTDPAYFPLSRVSPKYLPDFVLHGTTQNMDEELQEKLIRDLAHAIKVRGKEQFLFFIFYL